ncbi:MAG: hypothetical protein JWO50_713 [Candidatus Kaiserbacteria bacterium]|nr:hypothetical protein [Candidatus Kaiserbacteria bacterium]
MESLVYSRAFSTIEIVIALAIISCTVGSMALISYEGQSILLSGTMHNQAIVHAETMLENAQVAAHADERSLANLATSSDGVFTSTLTIGDSSYDPYAVRLATTKVSWSDRGGALQTVTMVSALTDYMNALSYDTCGALGGNWAHASINNHKISIGDLLPPTQPAGHTYSTSNPVTSVDVYRGIMSIAVGTTSNKLNDSFFVVDVQDPNNWIYKGGIDTNSSSIDGLENIASNGSYVFAANGHAANFKTCHTSASCAQLQVLAITNPVNPTVVANFTIPTSSTPFLNGSGGQAVGKTIILIGGYVYLGLTKSAGGPEFNIIDVHDPLHPRWVGGYVVGAGVSDIDVRRGYAYIATDSSTHELLILDVNDPTNPTLVSQYNVYDNKGWGNGSSVNVIGTTTYLGLTFAAGAPDLYTLNTIDRSTPMVISTATASSSIIGMIVRPQYAFLLTTTGQSLQVDSDLLQIAPHRVATIALPGNGRAIDCEQNTLYVGSSASGGFISDIHAGL